MGERLQKILSQWGIASRRKAETLIIEGRVKLNGIPATLGQHADPEVDDIQVDGKSIRPVHRPQSVYLLLNKPRGVVSTCCDEQGRKTVLDMLPENLCHAQGIHPVGRLDVASTGAIILTNDGELTFRLTHPSHSITKTYEVWVEGHPRYAVLRQWQKGVRLSGRMTRPAEIKILNRRSNSTLLRVILREGRNRQIRRIAEQLGHPVIHLHRVAIGLIQLATLQIGEFRLLTTDEVRSLW